MLPHTSETGRKAFSHCQAGQSRVNCEHGCETLKNFNFGSDSMKYIERPEYMQRLLDLMGPRISRSLPECAAAASLN